MKFDNGTFDAFRKDFAEAVKGLEGKYGVVLKLGSITYDYDSFHCKLEAKSGASKEDVMKREFERDCGSVGLYPEDYGQTFEQRGVKYEIVGIDLRKRKYPIIVREVATGKTLRCTADYVKNS